MNFRPNQLYENAGSKECEPLEVRLVCLVCYSNFKLSGECNESEFKPKFKLFAVKNQNKTELTTNKKNKSTTKNK